MRLPADFEIVGSAINTRYGYLSLNSDGSISYGGPHRGFRVFTSDPTNIEAFQIVSSVDPIGV